jgi:hypothetical protein
MLEREMNPASSRNQGQVNTLIVRARLNPKLSCTSAVAMKVREGLQHLANLTYTSVSSPATTEKNSASA